MVYVKLRHSLMGMGMGLLNHASSNLARITVEEVLIIVYSLAYSTDFASYFTKF